MLAIVRGRQVVGSLLDIESCWHLINYVIQYLWQWDVPMLELLVLCRCGVRMSWNEMRYAVSRNIIWEKCTICSTNYITNFVQS